MEGKQAKKNLGFKWPLIVGGFGFLAGYIGPIILAPDANQGPLLGIFITGPLGFFAGLILWFLSAMMKWHYETQKMIAIIACGLFVLGILAVGLAPKPEWVGRLYEIEVSSCKPTSEDFESILITKILQERVVKKEKPLFKADYFRAFSITTQKPQILSFYIQGNCVDFPSGFKNFYFVTDHPLHQRDKAVLEPIPDFLKSL